MNKTDYRMASIRAKSNVHYTCQECGSTEFIQAHHQIPHDDSSIIVLCAVCHSRKHPDVPLGLFFNKNGQPYWENISASSLASELNRHPRTIYRIAKKLNIAKGILTHESRLLIERALISPKRLKVAKVLMPIVKLPRLKCLRCGHVWIPRSERDIRLCPKCKSIRWDEPLVIKSNSIN